MKAPIGIRTPLAGCPFLTTAYVRIAYTAARLVKSGRRPKAPPKPGVGDSSHRTLSVHTETGTIDTASTCHLPLATAIRPSHRSGLRRRLYGSAYLFAPPFGVGGPLAVVGGLAGFTADAKAYFEQRRHVLVIGHF
jgi:hypothetical protein